MTEHGQSLASLLSALIIASSTLFVESAKLSDSTVSLPCPGAFVSPSSVEIQLPHAQCSFRLDSADDLSALIRWAEAILKGSRKHENPNPMDKDRTEPLTSRDRRGLQEVVRLAGMALKTTQEMERDQCTRLLREIAAAISNNRRPPTPPTLGFARVPLAFLDHAYTPMALGRTPAANVARVAVSDPSRENPCPGPFWRAPSDIAGKDLYVGFDRTSLPSVEDRIWNYEEAKKSLGVNPGFEVQSGNEEMKLKFGETRSEPFTARIFWALGYHVDATDHAPGIKVRYDRRLFLEFNSRKDATTQFQILWIPVYKLHLQNYADPFHYIRVAVLQDGTRLSAADLKSQLLRRTDCERPESRPDNYRESFERTIDYLVTIPANVQIEDDQVKSIGPWDFNQLGHGQLRELRGAGLLAAWLGWGDVRFENTRVKRVAAPQGVEILHYFSDLGGGLGRGSGLFFREGENPNAFPWTFTRAWPQRPGEPPHPSFRIVGFKPIEDAQSFREMDLDDARWMARLIAQLTPRQLAEALIASGFDAASARLYLEKLLSRRDRMIQDLGLDGEIALLQPRGADRRLSYDPQRDQPLTITLPSGKTVAAPDFGTNVVRNGKLWAVETPSAPIARQTTSRR